MSLERDKTRPKPPEIYKNRRLPALSDLKIAEYAFISAKLLDEIY
jgi:hypothetical protein